jgi:methylated-DNA-[protein]-cysteine S-methyltransferase
MKAELIELPIATPDGIFRARYSEKGLAGLQFPNAKTFAKKNGKTVADKIKISAKIRGWHRATENALKKILAGDEPKKFPPLDFSGTDFQKSVWRELKKISLGKTKSYGEIAVSLGKPKAVRALGNACGKNPIPVLIPCHRVLAANKKLGGFTSGLAWKRKLLANEGIKFEKDV